MAVRIDVTIAPAITVDANTAPSTVIEVLRGAKGDQNVYVGDTPPSNPQEGWIWIDTSA